MKSKEENIKRGAATLSREILCQSVSSEAAGVLANPDGERQKEGRGGGRREGSNRRKEDKRGPNEEWRIRKRKKGARRKTEEQKNLGNKIRGTE